MGNLHKTARKDLGITLIVVMLFLLVASFLALSLLNTSLLETKMSGYYRDKAYAFYKAENNLEKYEQEILDGKIVSAAITGIANAGVCGATFYRVVANAEYHGMSSILQSTFAKVGNLDQCKPMPNIKPGRQSFLIVQ